MFNLQLTKINIIIKFFICLITVLLIFLTNYHFSNIAYFYSDHRWFESLHNLSLKKGFFEIMVNSTNINGIIWQPINHNLNILSKLNFNLKNENSYLIYLSFVRFFELTTILIFVKFFTKKKFIEIILPSLLIFFICIHNFQIFDHNSYINFPIIFFNFGVALSLFYIERRIIFFLILLITNFCSFFINPIYFFIPCFLPLLFLYAYLIYYKKFINFYLSALANIPFALMFSLIAIGTGRINVSDKLNTQDSWYNFELFKSPIFFILFSMFFLLRIFEIYKSRKIIFFDYIFLPVFILISVFGFIWKFELVNWQLPQPQYYDYSFQYIYLAFFIFILTRAKPNFLNLTSYAIIGIIFLYKAYGFTQSFSNYKEYRKSENLQYYDKKKYLVKKFFWEKDNNSFFEKDLKNKTIFLDIPNLNTEFFNAVWKDDDNYNLDQKLVLLTFQNFKQFNHNLWHNNFHNSLIRTNLGNSAYMGISTYLANMYSDTKKYDKENIPKTKYNSNLINIYMPEYFLTDKKLPMAVEKEYKFDEFSIFLYKYKKAKLTYNYNVVVDKNLSNYNLNLNKFDKKLFLSDNKFLKSKNVPLCNFVTKFPNNYTLSYQILENENMECLALLPLTFSYTNNLFFENDLTKCNTFRVQYFFHGCYVVGNKNLMVKKMSLIKYPFYSLKDYIYYKRYKSGK